MGSETLLDIASVICEDQGDIVEGVLICPNPECLSEYPIIDGIPVLVADLRSYISRQISPILARTDLSSTIESLLGDCCGPSSAFDTQRQHLSSYTFDHYGDMDPQTSGPAVSPGSVLRVLEKGLTATGNVSLGPVIDIGCSVGRTSFALAETVDDVILGVDLNFDMLRTAGRILRHGLVRYPLRRVGMVYDRREFAASFPGAHNVDFWACDATALPFAAESFSLAVSLNLLDCVSSPYDHLLTLTRILKPGAKAIICTPFDWSVAATPMESWLGGHSQRTETRGASEVMLRTLLAKGRHPQALRTLELESEIFSLPWSVRLHDRSVMQYQVYLGVVRNERSDNP